MKYGFLFGAGAETGYGLPSGGSFALDIFRYDSSRSKEMFKYMRDNVDPTTSYASDWLPNGYKNKNISSFGKGVFQNIIKDTVEHNRSYIIEQLNNFDEIAESALKRLKEENGFEIRPVIEAALRRDLENIKMGNEIAFIDEFQNGNDLFNNSFFAAFLLLYKKKDFFTGEMRTEFRKILLSVLQLQVGALSEQLTRKISDSLFKEKDDEIDILDDLDLQIKVKPSKSEFTNNS